MNRIIARLAAATLAILVAACAAGPQFAGVATPTSDRGDVYLYRGSNAFALGQPFDVLLDGKNVGKLYNASYLLLRLPAGTAELTVFPGGSAPPKSITIRPEPGKALFYEFDFQFVLFVGAMANSAFPNAAIQPRSQERALEDLKELKAAK